MLKRYDQEYLSLTPNNNRQVLECGINIRISATVLCLINWVILYLEPINLVKPLEVIVKQQYSNLTHFNGGHIHTHI